MHAPLLSRPVEPEKLRREIAALDREIESIRNKRDGAIRALSERRVKKARLESQLALVGDSDRVPANLGLCSA